MPDSFRFMIGPVGFVSATLSCLSICFEPKSIKSLYPLEDSLEMGPVTDGESCLEGFLKGGQRGCDRKR